MFYILIIIGMDLQETVLSYGQKAVWLSFNPSGDERVNKAKELFAQAIDLMVEVRNEQNTWPSERSRLASVAITEAQTAQMWAVKAITWKD